MAAAGGDGLTIPRRRMPKNGENRSWCFLTPTKQEIKRAADAWALREGRCCMAAAAGGPLLHGRCGKAAGAKEVRTTYMYRRLPQFGCGGLPM
jgi:NAD(P)H-hydrate repair Nnr-like enzyme with NAD(P)H-hydrate dehydratase domain